MSARRTRLRAASWLACAALLAGACGGKSAAKDAAANATGATGGSEAGATGDGTGGTGDVAMSSGGAATSSGGAPVQAAGGTGDVAMSSGGATGGSAPAPNCDKVECPAIPASCKRIVQDPNECCPTCPDTGCDPCPALDCPTGMHPETPAGDCCPSCVEDPPDRCEKGQADYADLRAALLDKYGSSGCKNSSDCELVTEDTACAYQCNVVLPRVTVSSFVDSLASRAMDDCATCAQPEQVTCTEQVAACVNGRCLAASGLE